MATQKGKTKKIIKLQNAFKKILEGKYYDYNNFGSDLPISFLRGCGIDPFSFNKLKICHYCRELIRGISERKIREEYDMIKKSSLLYEILSSRDEN